jgi:hypothetical protein
MQVVDLYISLSLLMSLSNIQLLSILLRSLHLLVFRSHTIIQLFHHADE